MKIKSGAAEKSGSTHRIIIAAYLTLLFFPTNIEASYIAYAVPKEAIGITEQSGKISFKRTDNVQDEDGSGEFKGEILDFYRTGDAAPGGRFKYVYSFEIPYVTLSGDINGDGDVNNKDVVVLFRYVSGNDKETDEKVYDFNEDDKVGNKDVAALFRHVSAEQ